MAGPSSEHDLVAVLVVDAAFFVQTTLGPELLKPVYAQRLACE
jgi:hypothetical protein